MVGIIQERQNDSFKVYANILHWNSNKKLNSFLEKIKQPLYIVLEQTQAGVILELRTESYKSLYENHGSQLEDSQLSFLLLSKNTVKSLFDTIRIHSLLEENDIILHRYPIGHIDNLMIIYTQTTENNMSETTREEIKIPEIIYNSTLF